MNTLEKLIDRHRKLYEQLRRKIDAAYAEGVDEARQRELEGQVETMTSELERLETQIETVRKSANFRDYAIIVREGAVAGAGADGPEGTPTEANLRHRRELLSRAVVEGGTDSFADEEKVLAMRRYPAEEIHFRLIAEAAFGRRGGAPQVTPEQRAVHAAWLETQARAVADGFTGVTPNLGMEYVPDVLDARIRLHQSDGMRPLATDELVSVTRVAEFANRNVSTMDKTAFAEPRRPATDRSASNPATGAVTLQPIPYDRLFAFDAPLWLGPVTDLEAKIVMNAANAFGGALNRDRTIGVGAAPAAGAAGRITGIIGSANNATGVISVSTAAGGAITEANITALLAALPEDYHNQPSTRVMFNRATELQLYALRDATGGNRIFDIDPVSRKLILPLGFEYEVNSAMQSAGKAGNKLAMVADFSQYEVLYALGGMRFATDYEIISDQFLIGMTLHTDGKPAFDDAVARLVEGS